MDIITRDEIWRLKGFFILNISVVFMKSILEELGITEETFVQIVKKLHLDRNFYGVKSGLNSEFFTSINGQKFRLQRDSNMVTVVEEDTSEVNSSKITAIKDIGNGNVLITISGIPFTKSQGDRFMQKVTQMKQVQIESAKRGKKISKMQELNRNHRLADSMPLQQLKLLLEESEVAYYNSIDDPDQILEDRVYDYAKEMYRNRADEIANGNGLEHVPKPVGRLVPLPVWMSSMDKINEGTGEVASWIARNPGPWNISAKMDGASALYFMKDGQYKLYSRGKDGEGQDLSELLQYMHFPNLEQDNDYVGCMVRGELIMKDSVFRAKYQKTNQSEAGKYRNARNAVAGLVNKIGSRAAGSRSGTLNMEFIQDVDFIAYELIVSETEQLIPSEQFQFLELKFGDNVAKHEILEVIDDSILSSLYDAYIANIDYEIDGLIVCNDTEYVRAHGENPKYARAFKKPLDVLTKVTTVIQVEWNVSKDGYIKPTLIFDPIEVGGVTLSRATAYNAKYVVDNVLGHGSIIEVTRSGGVIPKVIKFLKASDSGEPDMPTLKYLWNQTKVDVILDETNSDSDDDEDVAAKRDINIKRLHFFLTSIGTKGVGETTMGKMYDAGVNSVKLLVNLKAEQIKFLGPKMSEKIIAAIKERLPHMTLPILMAGSGVFGRGLGQTRFEAMIAKYPNLMDMPEIIGNDIDAMRLLFLQVDGFAGVFANQTATRFHRFIAFMNDLSDSIEVAEAPKPLTIQEVEASGDDRLNEIRGFNVVMTGFRDAKITDAVTKVGGKIQSQVSGRTNLVIRKNADFQSASVHAAESGGIKLMTKEDFYVQYIN